MTKTQIDRQHQMTAPLCRELEMDRAMRELNEFRDSIDWKQDRTPAQKEMLSSIPPLTAFMGMEG